MYVEQMFVAALEPDPQLAEDDLAARPAVVEWQASLFAAGDPGFDPSFQGLRRLALDEMSWLDHLPRWLEGSDHVFAELVARLPWHQRTVPMYDRLVQEPRLVWWWTEADGASPLPVLDEVRRALSCHYDRHFDSIGCNYYRDGADSVAWHGDRMRHTQVDPMVAIVSVGAPRPFLLRPRGGGHSTSFLLGQGDLLVMGGAVQHDWEHTVPKVAAAGPRISITFRHGADAPNTLGGRYVHETRHPSAGAQNRHVPATKSARGPGRLEPGETGRRERRLATTRRDTEGPPS
jgi:alkylated DNA repair dioxygenase AlkB